MEANGGCALFSLFHIHVDATSIAVDDYQTLINRFSFIASDFSGHPEGYAHFEPRRHLTRKLSDITQYHQLWGEVKHFLHQCAGFVGYLEGEFIPRDEAVAHASYTEKAIPFTISRRRLDENRGEFFRQAEIHITLHKDKSSDKLIAALLAAGLYGAYIPKPGGEYLVLTAQGKKQEIKALYELLKTYLDRAGGAYDCTLKEERAIDFELYGLATTDLPEVIDTFYCHSEI